MPCFLLTFICCGFKDFDDIDEKTLAKLRQSMKEMLRKKKGTWKIISTNPDSVFFNVPENPLHGKYAIRFFIDKNGWRNVNINNIYKIELTNDSTYLICNKGGIIRKSELYNWESKN